MSKKNAIKLPVEVRYFSGSWSLFDASGRYVSVVDPQWLTKEERRVAAEQIRDALNASAPLPVRSRKGEKS